MVSSVPYPSFKHVSYIKAHPSSSCGRGAAARGGGGGAAIMLFALAFTFIVGGAAYSACGM
jgi:hypothetical protein